MICSHVESFSLKYGTRYTVLTIANTPVLNTGISVSMLTSCMKEEETDMIPSPMRRHKNEFISLVEMEVLDDLEEARS
jgi:hypothetical protein